MARRAAVLGATGQIGRATVPALMDDGWSVTAIQRNPSAVPADWRERGVTIAAADRADTEQLRAAMSGGADVVVDVVAYDGRDARQLVEMSADIGSIVAISSAGVYVDAEGRTFPGTPDAVPEFPVPIPEDQPTVAPASSTAPTRPPMTRGR
jgi:uncharacterized protein YbjT (DUF2867 family)